MIFVIDDDEVMAECIARATGARERVRIFHDALAAMDAIAAGTLPELIFLDILLAGPDGFALLNELVSYEDTAQIPVVIVSSLEFRRRDLANYNVVGVLNKDTMLPQEIAAYVR